MQGLAGGQLRQSSGRSSAGVILLALIGLIGTAIKNPQPHDIQVGLVGPAQAVQQISGGFESKAPGAFQFTTYGSVAAARAAIDARSVDGCARAGSRGPSADHGWSSR